MGSQLKGISITQAQSRILDLEKYYYDLLWGIFTSKDFEEDLINAENFIQNNYAELSSTWKDSNKIKVSMERITRHHVYRSLLNDNKIEDIYPSPISGDLGFITNDAVINIDAKTICSINNHEDKKWLQFLPNQTNFVHKRIESNNEFKGFEVKSNLPTYYMHKNKKLPILTFFIKVLYADNKKTFVLDRNKHSIPTLSFICMPNGELSNLFSNELITGFKDYIYYTEKDGQYFKPKLLGFKEIVDTWVKREDCFTKIKHQFKETSGWMEIIRNNGKKCLFDSRNNKIWYIVPRKNNKNRWVYRLEAVKRPNTPRINPETLKHRFDPKGNLWFGYSGKIIKDLAQITNKGSVLMYKEGHEKKEFICMNKKEDRTPFYTEEVKYSVVSLCSGIGGMDLGFIKSGCNIVFANDIDSHAVEIYRRNIGEINHKDIRNIPTNIIPDFDILIGGFPVHKEMNLFYEYIRVIRDKRPRSVVLETIKQVFNTRYSDGSLIINTIIFELNQLGYRVYYKLLNAKDFGVPQNKPRVIIVAIRNDIDNDYSFPDSKCADYIPVSQVLSKMPLSLPNCEYIKLPSRIQEIVPLIKEGESCREIRYKRLIGGEISGSLTYSSILKTIHPIEDGLLTVREIARLQTFPDTFVFSKGNISNHYKLICNSFPPLFAYELAINILKTLKRT